MSMASTVKAFGLSVSPTYNPLNLGKRVRSRFPIRCSASRDSMSKLSSDSVKVNGAANGAVKEERASFDFGNGRTSPNVVERVREKEEKLGPLWDDGYGNETVKDYFDYARDLIKPDGGPVRWFTPITCGPHLRDSPLLFFLPGMDGLGLGLVLHHKSLGK